MSGFITMVLAAGKGTRMKSALPKVLHQVSGKPMLEHVLAAAKDAGSVRNVVVIGFGADSVARLLGSRPNILFRPTARHRPCRAANQGNTCQCRPGGDGFVRGHAAAWRGLVNSPV